MASATGASAQVKYYLDNHTPTIDSLNFRVRINYVDANNVTYVADYLAGFNDPHWVSMPPNCAHITGVRVAPPLNTDFIVAGCHPGGRIEIQHTWDYPPGYAAPHRFNVAFNHYDCTGCTQQCPQLCGTGTCDFKGVEMAKLQ